MLKESIKYNINLSSSTCKGLKKTLNFGEKIKKIFKKRPSREDVENSDWTSCCKGPVLKEELEENLRDWFGKSSGKTKSGKRVGGWVQVGGKYDGAPCAKQPGQKTKPKCVSSAKRRSMSKKERESAARRKRKKDPNPDRRGKAKNVSTDPQKKRKKKRKSE